MAMSVFLAAGGAWAQEAGTDGDASDEASGRERVVVTATRGSKAVEKIPGAVSVISRRDIETQGLVTEDPMPHSTRPGSHP